jgi:biopolymer transport protein ExbD
MAMQLGTSGVKSDINVTPFVDIVLVLLIIFMVVTPMLSKSLDLSVPPKAVAEEVTDVLAAEQLILTIKGPDYSPRLFLNQEEIVGGPQVIGDRVAEIMKGRRDKVVFFQAENEVPYQFVVNVLDAARGAGVKTLGMITDEHLMTTATGEGAAAAPAPQ